MKTLTSLEKIICQVEAAHGSYGIYTLKYQTCLFNLGVCFPFGNSSSTKTNNNSSNRCVLKIFASYYNNSSFDDLKDHEKGEKIEEQLPAIDFFFYVQNRIFGYSCRSSGVDFGFP